jgi:hypothetical protein
MPVVSVVVLLVAVVVAQLAVLVEVGTPVGARRGSIVVVVASVVVAKVGMPWWW